MSQPPARADTPSRGPSPQRPLLTLLEDCADELQRLNELAARLKEASNAKEEQLQAFTRHLDGVLAMRSHIARSNSQPVSSSSGLSLLPPGTRGLLSYCDRERTLQSSSTVRCRVCMYQWELDSGVILDATESTHSTAHRRRPLACHVRSDACV